MGGGKVDRQRRFTVILARERIAARAPRALRAVASEEARASGEPC